ncbi:MAG: exodeoxyribonuclease VII large subunit [Verrucomicrobiota bacterium]
MDDLFGSAAKVLTVAELTRAIRGTLETKFGAVWVQGEVSNYKAHSSGHQYFTLKDSRAQISCVIFRNAMGPLRRPLTDGAQVQVYGQISVFEARGQYQLSVQILQPRGLGVLQAKFEALKRKLEAEGLFDPARKRPLPRHPRRIGIVTSPSGAAIRDMLNVLARRGRNLQILINPVRVQGSGAATEIAAAIRELSLPNENWTTLDVLVIARGGGSIEDLWEFNEEAVARAIFESTIPIVSAIGHEIDFTIADFVADLRAPTPSAAAELIAPDSAELTRRLSQMANALRGKVEEALLNGKKQLAFMMRGVLRREPQRRIAEASQRIDLLGEELARGAVARVTNDRQRISAWLARLRERRPDQMIALRQQSIHSLLARLCEIANRRAQTDALRLRRAAAMLRLLAPEATLERGYSVTMDRHGNILRSSSDIELGTEISTLLAGGSKLGSRVTKID